eukprot:1659328-Rhodomonas_salina.1
MVKFSLEQILTSCQRYSFGEEWSNSHLNKTWIRQTSCNSPLKPTQARCGRATLPGYPGTGYPGTGYPGTRVPRPHRLT